MYKSFFLSALLLLLLILILLQKSCRNDISNLLQPDGSVEQFDGTADAENSYAASYKETKTRFSALREAIEKSLPRMMEQVQVDLSRILKYGENMIEAYGRNGCGEETEEEIRKFSKFLLAWPRYGRDYSELVQKIICEMYALCPEVVQVLFWDFNFELCEDPDNDFDPEKLDQLMQELENAVVY